MSNYEKVKEWRSRPESKALRAAQARRYRAKHPEITKAVKDAYRERSKEERLPREAELARQRRSKDPEGQRRRSQAYLERQRMEQVRIAGRPRPELCEICGEIHLRIVFDHCHNHGHFRGWICDRCNKVLGLVKDSTDLLRKLERYLVDGTPKDINATFSARE